MCLIAVEGETPVQVHERRLGPSLWFWIAGIVVYGGAAVHFAGGHFLDQNTRDLWQHLAALKALIADPIHPANPFVPGMDTSRHFHPYWVALAFLSRAVGWNEWQAIAFAGFISAGVLLSGIYSFGRTFYRSPWGPAALLGAMVLSWMWPMSHTGSHSMQTLIEGIAYPACLLIGLSLLLWAQVIRAFEQPKRALVIVPLAALMFATHQLGAGIGFIAAGCFIAFQPDVAFRRRALVAAALGAGILLSTAWPYHNPLATMLKAGNSTWVGGPRFYGKTMALIVVFPSILGLVGLVRFGKQARPVLVAFAVFLALFLSGLTGILIATRFIMPVILMLHIGMGALFLQYGRKWQDLSTPRQLSIFAVAILCVMAQVGLSYRYLSMEYGDFHRDGSAYAHAQLLTRDIADQEAVAAYDVSAWPLAATGQRVSSVPWPEPGISNLAERQVRTEALFNPTLTRDQRIAQARSLGVRYLFLDDRGPERRPMPRRLARTLTEQSVWRRRSGHYLLFDLY